MGQIDEKYRLFDRTNGDPLMIGTLKELAEFMGDSYEYVFELSKEKHTRPIIELKDLLIHDFIDMLKIFKFMRSSVLVIQ